MLPKFFEKATQETRELSSKFLSKHGLNYFQYARSYKDGTHIPLVTHLDFVEKRMQSKRGVCSSLEGEQIDKQTYVFLWNANLPDVDTNMARDFDLDNGICFVERFPDYYNLVAFAAPSKETKIVNFYLNNLQTLKEFISEYSFKAQDLISESKRHAIPLDSEMQDTNADKLFWKKSKGIPFKHGDISTELSLREYECLKYCAYGETLQGIAERLQLSPRTVETYLDRTKSKLGLLRKSELIQAYLKASF